MFDITNMRTFNKVWVFIGISQNTHVLTLTNGVKVTQTKPVYHTYNNKHSILFDGLIEVLKMFKDVEIIYYAKNDLFAFEWNKECHENDTLPKDNREKWQEIKNLVKANRINLIIMGENSPLNNLGVLKE